MNHKGQSWPEQLEDATSHLSRVDRKLASVIQRVGPCTLKRQRNRFKMLARSIVSQQISVHAARAILGRLDAAIGGQFNAQRCAELSDSEMRAIGLSIQKSSYLRDLCQAVIDKRVRLTRIQQLSDAEVIDMLTTVRGIGRWTAEMFLIFSLGRLDILPVDDLGIRKGIQHLNELEHLPAARDCHALGEHWSPYASIASWYCWRIDSTVDFC